MIGAEHETARTPAGTGFTDAVTFSFADAEAGVYGLARIGLSPGEDGTLASALAVLLRGRDPVGALARGAIDVGGGADWSAVELPGLRATVEAPLERWTVAYSGAGHGFELTFTAISAPAELAADDPVAALGGMAGYDQLCRVEGVARAGDEEIAVAGLGQRGHAWGATDWDELELARSVSAWLGEEAGGVTLQSVRPAGAQGHDEEPVWASHVESGEPVRVFDPRLSTTYDEDGRQRRAGLELWVGEDDGYPIRAAGEVLCGSTLELGQLRLDLAFMRWHAEGHEGVGRYDVLRRAPG